MRLVSKSKQYFNIFSPISRIFHTPLCYYHKRATRLENIEKSVITFTRGGDAELFFAPAHMEIDELSVGRKNPCSPIAPFFSLHTKKKFTRWNNYARLFYRKIEPVDEDYFTKERLHQYTRNRLNSPILFYTLPLIFVKPQGAICFQGSFFSPPHKPDIFNKFATLGADKINEYGGTKRWSSW